MKKLLPFLIACLIFICSVNTSKAQSAGDYRTRASGAWNSTAVWQIYVSIFVGWSNTAIAPTNGDGAISILHAVSISGGLAVNADQITITSGSLTISDGTLNLFNGTGNDINVTGGSLIMNNAAATINAPSGSAVVSATSGAMSISSGTIASGVILYAYNSTALTISQATGAAITLNGSIYNYSTAAIWSAASATFLFGSSGYFYNGSAGILAITGSGTNNIGTASSSSRAGTLVNFGTITKSTSATLNMNLTYFNNLLLFQLTSVASTVNINATSTSSYGTFNAAVSGSIFNYQTTAKTFDPGLTYSGAGTHNINSTITYTNTSGAYTISGTTVNFNSLANIPNDINITNSTLNCNKGVTFSGYGISFFTGTNNLNVGSSGSFNTGVNDTLEVNGTSVLNVNNAISVGGDMIVIGAGQVNGAGVIHFLGDKLTNNGTIQNSSFKFENTYLQYVTGSNGSIATMEINNPDAVEFQSNHRVLSSFVFTNGRAIIDYKLYIPGAATISGYNASHYFYGGGFLKRLLAPSGSYIFPVGNLDTYLPATITTASTFVTDTVWVAVDNNTFKSLYNTLLVPIGNNVNAHVVEPVWKVNESTAAGSVFTSIKLQWNKSNENYLFNRASCGIVRNSTGSWNAPVAGAAAGSDPYNRTLSTITLGGNKAELFGIADNSVSYANNSLISSEITRSVCAGTSYTFSFSVLDSNSMNVANIFTAQLSDANGSFVTPVNIGSVTARGGRNLSVTIPGGTAVGNYSIRMISSNPLLVETKNNFGYYNQRVSVVPFCYCGGNLSSVSCAANQITYVNLNTIGKSSNCDQISGLSYTSRGIEDYNSDGTYTPNTTYITRGTSETITVTTNAASIISVWIDYNRNGIFESSEWTQLTTASTANVQVVGTLAIPSGASLGLTGMRIRSRAVGSPNGAADACTIFGSGETEDYFIYIEDAPTITSVSPTDLNNCASPAANVVWNFNTAVTAATVNSDHFVVHGSMAGAASGTYSGGGTSTVTFTHPQAFEPGELVTYMNDATVLTSSRRKMPSRSYQYRATAAVAPKTFKKHALTGSGNSIVNTYTSDFNNDGFADILDVNQAGSNFSISLGNGNGTFANPSFTYLSSSPRSAAIADFDLDGDMDIAIACASQYRVDLFYNQGSLSFSGPFSVTTSYRPFCITPMLGSENHLIGLAYGSQADNGVGFIKNFGLQMFEYANVSTATAVYGITSGDFDESGTQDVAVSCFDNTIRIYELYKNNLLLQNSFSCAGTFPIDIQTGDLNADGDLDLVWTNYTSGTLASAVGAAAYSFGTPTAISASGGPYKVVLADFDGDCDLDVAASFDVAAGYSLFQNTAGSLSVLNYPLGNFTPGYANVLAAADFDEDGDMDLTSSSIYYNAKYFLENAAYTIQTGSLTGPFCDNASTTVSWTVNDSLPVANSFYVQLSDASGSFASPTYLDTVFSNFSGSTTFIMPTVTAGTGYRIRVISTTQGVTIFDNGANLAIGAGPSNPNINFACSGTSTILSATGGASYNWSPATYLSSASGSPVTATPAVTQTITLIAKDIAGCPSAARTASVGPTCYCYPNYLNNTCSNDYIASVVFNTLNYSSPSCGGNDNNTTINYYTTITPNVATDLSRLSSYTLSLAAGISNPEGFGVWIDYNKDGDYDDSGEFVYASPTTTNQTFTSNITIPGTATLGVTRMRVMVVRNSLVTSTQNCLTTIPRGETQDFYIRINGCAPPTNYLVTGGGTICSSQTTAVNLSNSTNGVRYALYKNSVPTGTSLNGTGTALSFSNISSAGTYSIYATTSLGCTLRMQDSVSVFVVSAPTTANAGSDQTKCGQTSATLAANAPTSGTGAWTIVSGSGGSFSSTTNPLATFTAAAGSTNTLRWTISNSPCASSSDDVTISFPLNPSTAAAGPDQLGLCGLTSTTLAANAPTVGTGAWTIVSGTGGSFSNTAAPASTFIGTSGNTYTLRWTITNSTCTPSTDDVVIAFPKNPTPAAAGASQTLCGATSTALSGNTPVVGTGTWTIFSGTGGSLGNPASASSSFSGVAGNSYVLFWTISNAPCTASADSLVISYPRNPSTSDAGTAQTLCGLTTTALAANVPTVGTGLWTIVTGTGGSFANASSATSNFTGVAGNSYTLRWTISNSPCTSSSSDVSISFPRNPTTAAAGPDQLSLCGLTSATLAANTPTAGTGAWTIVSGAGGSFSNAASPTSTFIGTAGTSYTLRWTISNAPCTASSDDVVIAFPKNPTTSNAGASQTLCGLTSATLAGNVPTAGTGIWTIFTGTGGVLANANSATSGFTGVAGNTYVLFWTISNSPCTASADSMVVSFPKNPTTAAAGGDQTLCGATSTTLAANTPTVGTGLWTKVSGVGGTFGNTAAANSSFTGTAGNSYTLRWTISNSPCTASSDDVLINFPLNPTVSSAGNDTNICNGSTINLKANTALVGTGAWTLASGSCVIANASSPTSTANTFTNNAVATLVWSISNGVCPTSRDTVKINSNASFCAATLADFAANSTTTCTGATITFTDLSSNATSWNWNFGANASPASANTQGPHVVSYGATGAKTVSLTATGPGGSNTATKTNYITVIATPGTPTGITGSTAICAGTTAVIYSISAVTFATNYVWTVPAGASITSGGGTTSITVNYSTSAVSGNVTVYAANTCGNSGVATLAITVSQVPTTSQAGFDQLTLCGTTTANLTANAPTVGTGGWSIVSGGVGSFSNAASPVSSFTGTAGNSYILRWTISNGSCTSSTDDVAITFNQNPSAALAGSDQLNLCGLTSATLAANVPSVGTGLWTILSGSGGSLSNATSASSVFVGVAGNSYTLRWTITNSPCSASSDDVAISFPQSPSVSLAGSDQSNCGATATVLAANTPLVGTGVWSIVTGTGGAFANVNSPSTTFTGTAGTTYTLRWTISNAPCAASTDDVSISFPQIPSTALAGSDQLNLCGTTTAGLAANVPLAGNGLWTIVSGGTGSFSNAALATSTFTGTAGNTYTLRWTISNAPCLASSDDVVITFNQNPTAAAAGPDQLNLCGVTSATLAANTPSIGIGTWTVISGTGGSFSNINSATTVFVGTAGSTYTLRWTIANAPCSNSTDDVVIAFPQNPTIASAGSDQTSCGAISATLAGNTALVGTGIWTVISGAGGSFANSSSAVSTFNGVAGNTYTLRWTITNSPCSASSDDVIISFPLNPSTANAGTDQLNLCGVVSTALSAITPGVGTGTWSIVSGSGGSFANATSATSSFSGTMGSSYTLRWTVANSPCVSNTDDVAIAFNPNPSIALAGNDQTLCGAISTTLAANVPLIGVGAWSVISGVGGSFTSSNNALTTFIGTAGATYTLRWTISNAPCGSTSDDVAISFPQNPTIAAAGADQTLCGLTSTSLNANTPTIGSGLWTIVSGTGGSFSNSSAANSSFTGVAGGNYTLRWTISNAPCGNSTDDVLVSFPQNPSTANAGIDQLGLCGVNSTNLNATIPLVGTGVWTVVSGLGGSFANASSASSAFTGTAGLSYTLKWTVSNASCAVSSDNVLVTFNQNPTLANAGPDQNLCGANTASLSANAAIVGSGSWSIVSGSGGSFSSTTSPLANFTGIAGTNYTLRWTISNAPCAATSDDVTISFLQLPSAAFAGNDTTICNGSSISLSANSPIIGTGQWSIVSGAANIINTGSATSIASAFAVDTTTILVWTTSNANGCQNSSDTVKIKSNSVVCIVTLADFTADTLKTCLGATVTYSDASNQATSWNWNFGAGATPATISGVGPHTVTYSSTGFKTVSLTVGGPGGTDTKTKTNYVEVLQVPGAAGVISGASTVCAGQTNVSYSIGSIAAADAYNWILPSGAGINTFNQNTITVDFGSSAVSGDISVVASNGCGSGAASLLSIIVNALPETALSISGNDTICDGALSETFTVPSIANANSYKWILSTGIISTSGSDTTLNPQITVQLTPGITSGTIQVYGLNACGNGVSSPIFDIYVAPYPAAAGTITGASMVSACLNQSGISYTVPAIANASSYAWTLPVNASIVGATNSTSIQVNYPATSLSGNVTVSGINACGAGIPAALAVTFNSVPITEICYATVDSATVQCLLFWQRPTESYVDSFVIYSDPTGGSNLIRIAALKNDTVSSYLDPFSSPLINPVTYQIATKDSCNNQLSLSATIVHKTINLNGTLTWGGVAKLYWNDYLGIADPGRYYTVLRDTTGSGPFNDTLATNLSPLSGLNYTDLSSYQYPNCRYLIAMDFSTSCDPTQRIMLNRSTSRSNIKNRAAMPPDALAHLGSMPFSVQVFPNPASRVVNVVVTGADRNYSISIADVLGQVVLTKSMKATNGGKIKVEVGLSGLAPGVYFVTVQLENNLRKVMKLQVE